MSDSKLIYCNRCIGFMPHETLRDDYVECCGCRHLKSLNDPEVIEAEIATRGDARRT